MCKRKFGLMNVGHKRAKRGGGGRMKIFSSVHDETHLKIVWSQIPDFLHILHS